MDNIFEILNSLGIDIGGQKSNLEQLVRENYKTINEFEKLKDKKESLEKDLSIAKNKITELGDKAKNYEGTDQTIEDLKNEIEKYKQEEVNKQIKAKEEKEEIDLRNNFEEVVKDKKFVNEFTKNAIFDEIKLELGKSENKGKGISELFQTLTNDKEGIFANANPEVKLGTTEPVDVEIQTTADYIKNKLYNN